MLRLMPGALFPQIPRPCLPQGPHVESLTQTVLGLPLSFLLLHGAVFPSLTRTTIDARLVLARLSVVFLSQQTGSFLRAGSCAPRPFLCSAGTLVG